MNDPDQDLATILAALKTVDPPAGMEHRLLRTTAAGSKSADTAGERAHDTAIAVSPCHAPSASPTVRSLARCLSSPLARASLGVAAAGVLALSLTLTTQDRPLAHPPAATLAVTPDRRSSISPRSPTSLVPRPLLSSATPPAPDRSSSRTRPRPASHRVRLPSFPAPPMPLTAQEKLLLRVAHARDPQQSPVLNPALRASLAARDREDFQIFFAPATTVRNDESSN